MKCRYDRNREQPELQEGGLVLLSAKRYTPHRGKRKLILRYAGPYLIARRVHPNTYELNGLPPDVPKTKVSIPTPISPFPSPIRIPSRAQLRMPYSPQRPL